MKKSYLHTFSTETFTDLVGKVCVPFGIPDDGQSSQSK